jgi:hypothetical protein
MTQSISHRLVLAGCAALFLSACLSSGNEAEEDSATTTAPDTASPHAVTRLRVTPEAGLVGYEGSYAAQANSSSPSSCSGGVTRLEAGKVTADSVLAVMVTHLVCHDVTSAPAVQNLARMTHQLPDSRCPHGGVMIESGADAHSEGTPAEGGTESSASHACHDPAAPIGATTAPETGGATAASVTGDASALPVTGDAPAAPVTGGASAAHGPGAPLLLIFIPDPTMSPPNCPLGGVKVFSGTDANANGALDATEATEHHVCYGRSLIL